MIFRRGCLAREKAPQKVRKTICFLIDIDKVCKTRSLQVNYISLVFGGPKKKNPQAPFTGWFFFLRPANILFQDVTDMAVIQPKGEDDSMSGGEQVRVLRWFFGNPRGQKHGGVSPVFSRKWPAFLRVAGGKRGIVAVPCCDECELKHWLWDGVKRLVFSVKCTSCTSNTNHICTPLEEMAQWRIFFKWVGSNAN